MDNLPIELWHLIFDHLQLTDLSSCAQVCKAVYLTVKEYRIREIAFNRRVYLWFHFATPTIGHKHRVNFWYTSILQRSSFNFDYLKRLKIGRYSSIDLNEINRFVYLEELDIDLANYENEKSRTLSLANLKVLYLFMSEHLSYLKLDTPQLAKVCTFSLKKLEFVYPESIRCIHTFYHSGKLSMFRNLEYLTLTDYYNLLGFYNPNKSQEFSVTDLKNLKEIDFYYRPKYRKRNMDVFKRIAANLLALRRPDLKVFWFHVQMTDSNLPIEFERTYQTDGSLLAFQLKYHERLKKKDHFFWSYEFNGSMKKLSRAGFNPRSEGFVRNILPRYSFKNISVTGQVEEQEFLLELIARSSDLFVLYFGYTNLDQSFFDRMADTIRLNAIPLQQLKVETSGESLDFDFVSRLRDLEWFEINQELSIALIAKFFIHPSLIEIECSSDGVIEKIERLSTNQFLLDEETLSLQELLERFSVEFDSEESKLMRLIKLI